MKKLILLSALILLTACTVGPNKMEEDSAKKIENLEVVSTHPETTSTKGETCGGSMGINCSKGLNCIFDYDTADGHGVCDDKVTNEQECEEVYDSVCGLNNDRQKHNYFNECQMKRHGSELVNKGKCEVDANVAGNCEVKARGFGTCFETTVGYEFDGKSCLKKTVASCDNAAEIPFETMESCKAKCL